MNDKTNRRSTQPPILSHAHSEPVVKRRPSSTSLINIQDDTELDDFIIIPEHCETLSSKLERKIDELGNIISSFIDSKKLKMQKNNDPYDQDPPALSFYYFHNFYKNTQFTKEEGEYLFYLFRKYCESHKEHLPFERFINLFPSSIDNDYIYYIFHLFVDIELKNMGLETITYFSFINTLSIISRGNNSEYSHLLCKLLFILNNINIYKHDKHESTLTKEQIRKTILYFVNMNLPSITSPSILERRTTDGTVIYQMPIESLNNNLYDNNSFIDNNNNNNDDYNYDNTLYCINNRIIAFTSNNSIDIKYIESWINTILQVFPSNSITFSQLCKYIETHLSIPELFTNEWKLFKNLYGCISYINDLIINTMTNDLTSLETIRSCISEKEGFLIKNWGLGIFEKWKKHWSIVRDGFFWYYDCDNEVPILHEPERVICLQRATIDILSNDQFSISIPGYVRKFKAESNEEMLSWVKYLQSHSGLDNNTTSSDCYYPIRYGINAKWYVDGKDTMEAILNALLDAKEEIYIADWFLSPFIYLKREIIDGETNLLDEYRLDNILLSLAKKGIYILPWNETKLVMDLGSSKSQEYFNGLHENIYVIRHPIVTPVKWSHHQKIVVVDQKIAFIGGLDLCLGRWDDCNHSLTDVAIIHKWPGKDYYNPLYVEFERVHEFWDDLINRNQYPRMPWHDVHMSVDGSAAKDIARNFIQRWNHHKEVLSATCPHLIPVNSTCDSSGFNSVQVLRSICDWSAGIGNLMERSIYDTYIQSIVSARHYIYIENQYFISSLTGDIVKNSIAQCILDKICSAIQSNKDFKVIIVLPQHPEGLYYRKSTTISFIMDLQFKTISKGGNSILEQLSNKFPDVDISKYIGFYTLRNYGILSDYIVTEQIYVHSKIMIIDDRIAIIGSANTNDRSMFGNRDSEIGIKIFGGESIQSTLNGKPWKSTKFVHSLRISLWKEHLGLLNDNIHLINDPIESIESLWKPIALSNSKIYLKLFTKVPIDVDPNSIYALNTHETETKILKSDSRLECISQIQGHLTNFDMDYCSGYKLSLEGIDNLMEDDIFT